MSIVLIPFDAYIPIWIQNNHQTDYFNPHIFLLFYKHKQYHPFPAPSAHFKSLAYDLLSFAFWKNIKLWLSMALSNQMIFYGIIVSFWDCWPLY